MGDTKFLKSLFPGSDSKNAGRIVLLQLEPAEFEKVNFSAACLLSGTPGIYLSLGQLWRDISDRMERAKVETKNYYWIGGSGVGFWSHDSTLRGKVSSNVTLIEGPTAFTHLFKVIDLLLMTGKYRYLYLDSINVLADKNKPETVKKMVELLSRKLREKGVAGVFACSSEGAAAKLILPIQKYCDATLKSSDVKR